MTRPPQLSDEARKAALEKAGEARRARAEIKQRLKMGSLTLVEQLMHTSVKLLARHIAIPPRLPAFAISGSTRDVHDGSTS